jgi:gas vesicle protein
MKTMSDKKQYNYDDVLGQFAAMSLENKAKFLLKATFETAFSAFEELSNLMGDTYESVTQDRASEFAEKMQETADKVKKKMEEVVEDVTEAISPEGKEDEEEKEATPEKEVAEEKSKSTKKKKTS